MVTNNQKSLPLNFFLSFLQSPLQHPIPAYDFWQYYLKNGIKESGHHFSEETGIDWALGLVPLSPRELLNWKEKSWERTVTSLKKNPADFFLSYLYPHMIDASAIAEIKKMGIPCINFFCDHLRSFKKLPAEFSAFDLNWVPEYKALKLYERAGCPYIHLPMPMWVDPKLRKPVTETFHQITFLGSRDIQRQQLLERIIGRSGDLPLAVFGRGWTETAQEELPGLRTDGIQTRIRNQLSFVTQQGIRPYLRKIAHRGGNPQISPVLQQKIKGPASFEAYNQLTSASMVTMGINRYPSFHFPFNRPDSYSRLRDIEAPMLGACYLTEWTEGIEELYLIGKEIETYRNEDDFVQKAGELSNNAAKRERLRKNGQKRALETHSIKSSLEQLIWAFR